MDTFTCLEPYCCTSFSDPMHLRVHYRIYHHMSVTDEWRFWPELTPLQLQRLTWFRWARWQGWAFAMETKEGVELV